ncbi:MAG TPA: hypothetical protein VK470_09880, partial [Bacteroidota bacterium]|nr:hypothetical protein [Bacteroidota bacterium]
IKSDSANHVKKNFFQIDVADLERLEEEIGPRLAQKMIATETGDLSLGAVINGLKYTTIVFPSLKPRTVFTIVNNNIKTVVQNELVAREGMKRNYQQSENVRHDVNVWMDSRRSRLLMKAVTDTVAVGDDEIDAAVKLNIRRKLLDERKQQTLNNYLGALGRKYNVTMDTAKLRSVSTTTTSMVTWRTIGFGGRILAVPMVVPQTQWIRGMLPEKTINQ